MALATLVILAALPWGGVDLQTQKRLKLLLAVAATLLLVARHLAVTGRLDVDALRLAWLRRRRPWLIALAVLAALSLATWCNFFAFHGGRTFAHLHDLGHYYLGSKYYPELGYDGLYTAALRAEAEVYGDRFRALEARDLERDRVVHIRRLLERSGPVKARFGDLRWAEFRRDAAVFRDALGERWGTFLLDHGFNATPLWARLGGAVANRVPAGAAGAVRLLALLDPLLLLLASALVLRTFGAEATLLAVTLFALCFGAGFAWTGGAFLRTPWFVAVMAATCAVHRHRPATAGTLFAAAAMLRVFPALFALPFFARAAADLVAGRSPQRRDRRLVAAFVLTAVALGAATLVPAGGTDWRAFADNSSRYVSTISPNVVGLTSLAAFRGRPEGAVDAAGFEHIRQRRHRVHRLLLFTVFPALLLLVAAAARRLPDVAVAALGVPLIFVALSPAGYYWVFLVVPLLAARRRPELVALLFAGEAAVYTLMLFEPADGMLYLQRSLLVAWTLVLLYVPAGLLESKDPRRSVPAPAHFSVIDSDTIQSPGLSDRPPQTAKRGSRCSETRSSRPSRPPCW